MHWLHARAPQAGLVRAVRLHTAVARPCVKDAACVTTPSPRLSVRIAATAGWAPAAPTRAHTETKCPWTLAYVSVTLAGRDRAAMCPAPGGARLSMAHACATMPQAFEASCVRFRAARATAPTAAAMAPAVLRRPHVPAYRAGPASDATCLIVPAPHRAAVVVTATHLLLVDRSARTALRAGWALAALTRAHTAPKYQWTLTIACAYRAGVELAAMWNALVMVALSMDDACATQLTLETHGVGLCVVCPPVPGLTATATEMAPATRASRAVCVIRSGSATTAAYRPARAPRPATACRMASATAPHSCVSALLATQVLRVSCLVFLGTFRAPSWAAFAMLATLASAVAIRAAITVPVWEERACVILRKVTRVPSATSPAALAPAPMSN